MKFTSMKHETEGNRRCNVGVIWLMNKCIHFLVYASDCNETHILTLLLSEKKWRAGNEIAMGAKDWNGASSLVNLKILRVVCLYLSSMHNIRMGVQLCWWKELKWICKSHQHYYKGNSCMWKFILATFIFIGRRGSCLISKITSHNAYICLD